MSRRTPPIVPTYWSLQQALAVFEILDEIRDRVWQSYGPQIQEAMREDQCATGPTPRHATDQPDLPF